MAGEIMDFPNTFDEFAKSYGFKDKKEVYTNGSELIPVFRVKQWLEHILCDDAISRQAALEMEKSYNTDGWDMYTPLVVDADDIEELPPVIPQEPKCKNCKWWKDSDGKYRRGCGAESQCHINTDVVYRGEGYCYMFSPKEKSDRKVRNNNANKEM